MVTTLILAGVQEQRQVRMRVLFDFPLWLFAGLGLHTFVCFLLPGAHERERWYLIMALLATYVFVRYMALAPVVR